MVKVPGEQSVFWIFTPPPPWGKVSSFSGAAFGHMTLECMVFLLKHMWPQDFFLLCFSRVRMTAQNITCWKIDIKNVGIYVHNNSTHFAGYVTQRGIFFFFHLIWSPGELAQSHTLYKRQVKIHQFDSLRTVSCQLKTFTIQWSIKQLNISIQLTLTHAHTPMHTHENCDKRLNRTNFVTVLKRPKSQFWGVIFKYLKMEKQSDSTWFSDPKKSPLFNWRFWSW